MLLFSVPKVNFNFSTLQIGLGVLIAYCLGAGLAWGWVCLVSNAVSYVVLLNIRENSEKHK